MPKLNHEEHEEKKNNKKIRSQKSGDKISQSAYLENSSELVQKWP